MRAPIVCRAEVAVAGVRCAMTVEVEPSAFASPEAFSAFECVASSLEEVLVRQSAQMHSVLYSNAQSFRQAVEFACGEALKKKVGRDV